MPVAPRATSSPAPSPYVVPPTQEFDGNDGAWSTFKISIGSPGQEFRVLPSTKSGETYAVLPEGCVEGDGENCPSERGAQIFQSQQNSGFNVNESSTWSTIGTYDVGLEDRLGYSAGAMFGYDKVALGTASDTSSLALDHQVVGGYAETTYWMGYLPLGISDSSFSSLSQSIDSFLYQLRNATKIPSLSFAYTAGAKYRLKGTFGSLILGGYDTTRFNSKQNSFSFSFATDPSRLLTVGVESILASNSLKGTYSMSSGAHFSLVDSTVPHLWLPRDICDNFEAAFGLTYDSTTDLYLVNDTIHAQLQSKNPQVTIKLVNSLADTSINYTNIVLPYAAFDLQADYPYYKSGPKNYFPIRRAANDTQYTLGRTLLQEAYLIVDYERANFTITQAMFPDPLPAANIATIEPPSETLSKSTGSKSGLSTGAIAGIAAGSAALIIVLIIGIVLFCLRKRRARKRYELANTQVSESASGRHMNPSASALKEPNEPQELQGTQLAELASPREGCHKPFLNPNNPQELDTPASTPRWREVTAQHFYEMDGESIAGSRQASRAPSRDSRDDVSSPRYQDGTGRFPTHGSAGISPLTHNPRIHYNY